jgi:hypothetical protein
MTAAGSVPSPGGHPRHRGCPSRSRKVTCRVLPQDPQRSRRRPQARQYQSCPRRCMAARSLPHPAQVGGEITVAPAFGRDQQSPTTRGAGGGRRPGPCGRSATAAAGRACAAARDLLTRSSTAARLM